MPQRRDGRAVSVTVRPSAHCTRSSPVLVPPVARVTLRIQKIACMYNVQPTQVASWQHRSLLPELPPASGFPARLSSSLTLCYVLVLYDETKKSLCAPPNVGDKANKNVRVAHR